ncbi:MAG TPA: DUF5317 family protein [Chloroflexota bacterium]|nr:DUF5317 family protein [Chloroflexota bacterium]
MFLAVIALTLGALVGLLRGGRLAELARYRVRLKWLAVLCWLLQVGLFLSPLGRFVDPWAGSLHFASAVLIGLVILSNRHIRGLSVVGLGLLLNALVYAANGGFMPVAEGALIAAGSETELVLLQEGRIQKTFLMEPATPLAVLGDVVPIGFIHKVYSPGDLVATVGVFVLMVAGMEPRTHVRRIWYAKSGNQIHA